MKTTSAIVAIALNAALLASAGLAQTANRVQSSARPFDLDIAGPVMRKNSDARSRSFIKGQAFKELKTLLKGDLTTTHDGVDFSTVMLDPSRLTLQNDVQARAYFVQDDAGYHNSFGFVSTVGGRETDRKLIFPNASVGNRRSESTPLKAGDFVDFGKFAAGTQLDFFLIADGARGGTNTFSTNVAANPDGLRHVVSHAFTNRDSPYLMLAFEDLYGGGDEDYNDLVVALDIGAANVEKIIKTVGAPEPTSALALAAFVAVGAGVRHRKRRRRE